MNVSELGFPLKMFPLGNRHVASQLGIEGRLRWEVVVLLCH